MAEVPSLTQPISQSMGPAWLAAAVIVVASDVMLLVGMCGWWVVAAVAAGVSQTVIVTSWSDAKAGTVANVLLALAALYGFRAYGPTSFRARFRRLADEATANALPTAAPVGSLVAESDLAHLPAPVADYVRATGAVGRPRVAGFGATIRGRIRSGADKPWMPWTG